MISLVAAKMAYDAKDIDEAKTQLKWVIDNGSLDGYKAWRVFVLPEFFWKKKPMTKA